MTYDRSVVPSVLEPATLQEAWELKQLLGVDGKYVAGTTLLRTQWESKTADRPDHLIRLDSIPELKGVTWSADQVVIGAFTLLRELSKNSELLKHVPLLVHSIQSIAAPSIRNLATLGGNILSKIGDCIPVLLVQGSRLTWFDGKNLVEEPLQDWLQQIKEGVRSEDRILISVSVPIDRTRVDTAGARTISFCEKIGRREAFTASVVTIAFFGKMDSYGMLSSCRIAAGGGAAVAMRLIEAEKALNGSVLNDSLLEEMHQAVLNEFETYSDSFSTADYRKCTAANLLAEGIKKCLKNGKGGTGE